MENHCINVALEHGSGTLIQIHSSFSYDQIQDCCVLLNWKSDDFENMSSNGLLESAVNEIFSGVTKLSYQLNYNENSLLQPTLPRTGQFARVNDYE